MLFFDYLTAFELTYLFVACLKAIKYKQIVYKQKIHKFMKFSTSQPEQMHNKPHVKF